MNRLERIGCSICFDRSIGSSGVDEKVAGDGTPRRLHSQTAITATAIEFDDTRPRSQASTTVSTVALDAARLSGASTTK